MPRAVVSDKFFIYAPKKQGPQNGQRLLLVNHTHSGKANLEDLMQFLKEQGINPSQVPLPEGFVIFLKS